MEKTKRTICVTIGSQKGGVGKSTTTVLLASMINLYTDLKVAVIDVDPQHSINNVRKKEKERIENLAKTKISNDPLQKALGILRERKKSPFHIHNIDYIQIREEKGLLGKDADDYIVESSKILYESGKYDLIFYDFPGYTGYGIESERENIYARLLCQMHYVIVPLDIDKNVLHSTTVYLKQLRTLLKNKGSIENKLLSYAGFLWRYTSTKNKRDWDELVTGLGSFIHIFSSKVFESNDFKMGYSTLSVVDLSDGKSLIPFVNEFLVFCGFDVLQNDK